MKIQENINEGKSNAIGFVCPRSIIPVFSYDMKHTFISCFINGIIYIMTTYSGQKHVMSVCHFLLFMYITTRTHNPIRDLSSCLVRYRSF